MQFTFYHLWPLTLHAATRCYAMLRSANTPAVACNKGVAGRFTGVYL